jgi:hypothetical protein
MAWHLMATFWHRYTRVPLRGLGLKFKNKKMHFQHIFLVTLAAINLPAVKSTLTKKATTSTKKNSSLKTQKSKVDKPTRPPKAVLSSTRIAETVKGEIWMETSEQDTTMKLQTLTFSQHTKVPAKVEEINIIDELRKPDLELIYLDADPTIMKYLSKRQSNGDAKTMQQIELHLAGIFHKQSPHEGICRIKLGGGGLNYRTWSYADGKVAGAFHRDGMRFPGFIMLNVWVALNDVTARPLAFIKNRDGKVYPEDTEGSTPFDPNDEYIVASGMTIGQMLIFNANVVPHGSLIIAGNDGVRESITFAYAYKL